jgi:glycosyltransferase involved in cell wall biosynthesis
LAILFSIIVPVLNEERKMPVLLESIFRQSFRPIEVIMVDGGSKDRTCEAIAQRASEWNSQEFRITLVNEIVDGQRSAAHARNLGIRESKGEYVLLIDADIILSDVNIVNGLERALQNHEIARFRARVLKDTWLEYNLALDHHEMSAGWAFRRQLLLSVHFDDSLGLGDMEDFRDKITKAIVPRETVISEMGARHWPHSLSELKRQRRWYGRTVWLWLKKDDSLRSAFAVGAAAPFAVFVLSLLVLFMYGTAGLLPLGVFFAVPVVMLLRSPKRTAGRFMYLTLVRYIYASFCFSLGFAEGVVERIFRGRIDPSRGE